MFYGDNAEVRYTKFEEFMDRLAEVQRNTVWHYVSIQDLFIGRDEELMGSDAEFDTNMNGTRLFTGEESLFDEHYGVRECALRSLYNNLGLGGELMKRFDSDDMLEYIKFGVEKNKKYREKLMFKIPIVEEKANAFLTNKYVELPSVRVFDQVSNYLKRMLNGEKYGFAGRWTYSMTTGEFNLPIERELNGTKYKTELTVNTSDAGFSSISFRANLVRTDSRIPVMSDIYLEHKGDLDDGILDNALSMVEASIEKGCKKLEEMITTEIKHPITTLKRVARYCSLPKKDTLELIAKYKPTGVDTAFDLYLHLTQLLNNESYSGSVKERLEGDVYKALGINWSAHDIDGEFNW